MQSLIKNKRSKNFLGSLGVSEKRFNEIRDTLFEVTKGLKVKRYPEAVDKTVRKMELTNPAELIALGMMVQQMLIAQRIQIIEDPNLN